MAVWPPEINVWRFGSQGINVLGFGPRELGSLCDLVRANGDQIAAVHIDQVQYARQATDTNPTTGELTTGVPPQENPQENPPGTPPPRIRLTPL